MKTDNAKVVQPVSFLNKYFEQGKLDKLYFPNGNTYVHPDGEDFVHSAITKFHIHLTALYELMCDWTINGTHIMESDIVAVIAFGSAVQYPGYRKYYQTKKRFYFFGPKFTALKMRPIQPREADFLVISRNSLISEIMLEPVSRKTRDFGTWIEKGGIYLVNRGVDQIVEGVRRFDKISKSAFRYGVPVFFGSEFLKLALRVGEVSKSPRKLIWEETHQGCLRGSIS